MSEHIHIQIYKRGNIRVNSECMLCAIYEKTPLYIIKKMLTSFALTWTI